MAGNDIQLHQLLGMLSRRRKLVLAMAASGTVAAAVLALVLSPKFTAKAGVVVDPFMPALAFAQSGSVSIPAVTDSEVETHAAMMSSRDHLQRVLASLRATPSLTESTASRLGDLTIDEVEANTKVFQERKSRAIAVTYTSKHPAEAAVIANRIASLYVEAQSDRRRSDKGGLSIEQQVSGLQQQLMLARAAARDQSERLTAAKADGSDIDTLIRVSDNQALARLRAQQLLLERGLEEARSVNSPQPDKARVLAEQIRKVSTQISEEAGRIKDRIASELAATSERVRMLEARVQSLRRLRIDGHLADQVHPVSLPGNGNVTYDRLLQDQIASAGQIDAVSAVRLEAIADAPTRPSSVNRLLFLAPGGIALGLVGAVAALVLELLDRTVRSGRDIENSFKMRCAGVVPSLSGRADALVTGVHKIAMDALLSDVMRNAPRVIEVTTSTPGEDGESLAGHLAEALIARGRSVLLIASHERAEHDDDLITILEGGAKVSDIARIQDQGKAPVISGARLLATKADDVARFFERAKQEYDIVVISAPAVLGTTSETSMHRYADLTLLAIEWGVTPREMVASAAERLRKEGTDVHAVLTEVDLARHASYRFGDDAEVLWRSNEAGYLKPQRLTATST